MNREFIVSIAGKPLRALRSGRFPLSPVVARISPRTGAMMDSYRLEEQGRFDESLAVMQTGYQRKSVSFVVPGDTVDRNERARRCLRRVRR